MGMRSSQCIFFTNIVWVTEKGFNSSFSITTLYSPCWIIFIIYICSVPLNHCKTSELKQLLLGAQETHLCPTQPLTPLQTSLSLVPITSAISPIPQDILDTHSERWSSEDIYLHLLRFPYFELEDSWRKWKDDEVKPAKEIDPETKDVFNTLVRGVSWDEQQKADKITIYSIVGHINALNTPL